MNTNTKDTTHEEFYVSLHQSRSAQCRVSIGLDTYNEGGIECWHEMITIENHVYTHCRVSNKEEPSKEWILI